MKHVVTVLRSGGEFNESHVKAMQRQVAKWAPEAAFTCLSDVYIEGVNCWPLKYDWPGWWAKLELFSPQIKGDFLFTDLDNVILGPISHFFTRPVTTLQRNGWTALMWLPEAARGMVWERFTDDSGYHMNLYARENRPIVSGVGNYGDAGFISDTLRDEFVNWEDVLRGQVMNVVELRRHTAIGIRWDVVPPNVRVVLCGGPQHRPWKMPMFEKYKLYD